MLKHCGLTLLPLILFICVYTPPAMGQTVFVKQGQRELRYVLRLLSEEDGLRFRINLRCRGDATGSMKLLLPDRWGGQSRLYEGVRNLRVSSLDAKLSDTSEPHVKIITHRPHQTINIQYDLVQDWSGRPRGGDGTSYYRPVLQRDYFHWIGNAAWVRPDWNEEEPLLVFLEWKRLPKGWALGNSFGVNRRHQSFQATIEELRSAVFVGGDFRIAAIPIDGKPVYTALRGSWQFSDAAFTEMVRRIIGVEREFWRDRDVPYYLITLLPLEAPVGTTHTGGSGLTNSFAAFATKNAEQNLFERLIAHEHFHNWNSQKLGTLKEPEQLLYWFSEGFTDYYTNLLLLRGGLISLDEYLQQYNDVIHDYYLSPVRTQDNPSVLKSFWTDSDVQKLPYQRGFLLASNWNTLIRSATNDRHSLDDVMLDLLAAARQKKQELSAELINKHVSRYAGRDVMPDIQRYIEKGELITPDSNALGPHVELEMKEAQVFELGFDLETLRTKKVIAGVKENSAAYRAGLREGQIVVRRLPIEIGAPTKAVELTIKEGEGERTIRYYPASQSTIQMPAYRLRSGVGNIDRANNLRWLGVTLPTAN